MGEEADDIVVSFGIAAEDSAIQNATDEIPL